VNVTLRQLRGFLALARTGSFTLSAESLFITQSALSGLIKELEAAVGVRLVDRNTRRVHLTPMGRQILPVLEKLLSDLDGVLAQIADKRALRSGVVRVAASQLMASALFPDLIAAYREIHPGIRVELIDCPVETVMARVFAGEVDFGIGPERERNSDIVPLPLFEAPFVVVFPRGHALGRKKQARWSDLAAYPIVSLQGKFAEYLLADLRAAAPDLRLRFEREAAFMSTALAMVNSGLGITICTSYAATLVKLYGLEMRPLADPEICRSFEVMTRRGLSLSPAAQDFLEFISQKILALQYLRPSR
jgi:DNA-binding transcriptional LysR family regulator